MSTPRYCSVCLRYPCDCQQPFPERAPAEPSARICPECGGRDGMHVRRACRGVEPEPAPDAQERGTASLKPCATFVEGAIPEYCRTCNWSFESHQEPAGAQPSGAAEPKPCCRCAGPDKAIESCACTCHAITPETGSPEASPRAQQAPPETRSGAEIEAWNATWKAGYDAAQRDHGWRTFQEVRDENAQLRAALASAQQERDELRQACIAQVEGSADAYAAIVKQRDSAQAQLAALTARAEHVEQAAVLASADLRHGIKTIYKGQIDRGLVERAIRRLESAATPYVQPVSTPAADTPTQKE